MTLNELRTIRPGDRVIMTEPALRKGLLGHAASKFGTVAGTQINAKLVKVRRDGIKTADWYSKDFWALGKEQP